MITRAQPEPFGERLEFYRQRVNTHLEETLAINKGVPQALKDAMYYATLGPGKRIRPLLSYATGEFFNLKVECVDSIAVAIELVHAYSLIHDDLPAMDNDDLRRGRPTTHKKFNEAVAILTGDALQALAFESLSKSPLLSKQPQTQTKIIGWLANAAGASGMVGGQLLDLEAEEHSVDETALADIHQRKTGRLIQASIMMPSELANPSAETIRKLDRFANDIGLAFQIRDDLLEVEQDTEMLGKNIHSDENNKKTTYPSLLGLEDARNRASGVYKKALETLEQLGERAAGLRWVSDYIMNRSH
uniref:Geranyltranstransferase (IspA) n=1 Tax=uncultured marine thaumarchaeote KM3_54_G03 TaxID=1456192 RepID=A0A075HE27_9ARCH|nr:geranyltranstransferase (ispA) [uncultured marine thaumarchaeote KM3_54_G03]